MLEAVLLDLHKPLSEPTFQFIMISDCRFCFSSVKICSPACGSVMSFSIWAAYRNKMYRIARKIILRQLSEGRIIITIIREDKKDMTEFYRKIKELNQSVKNYALTLVDGENYGGKILISDGKIIWQSVQNISISLPAFDITNGIQEISGHKFYAESLNNSAKIVTCGAGNIALSVIRLAKFTGFYVSCIDDRQSFTEEAKRIGADYAVCDSFGHALSKIPADNNTYFIIATRGHSHDMECLRPVCAKPHAYIGLVGSRKRAKLIREKLSEEGISAGIHAPIGLSIETETPEEIAVSIMAEVIREKNTRGKKFRLPGRNS